METFSPVLIVLIGVLLRFGLPILVTVLFVYFLRRMDARWQEEARQQMSISPKLVPQTPCWEVNHCAPEKRLMCQAFINPEIPCWQQFRSPDGLLRETCLGCRVYQTAAVPVAA
jgi:hypothetical protein